MSHVGQHATLPIRVFRPPVVAGSAPTGPGASRCGPDARSSRPSSSSDRGLRVSGPYAWSLRNCVQVGPTRRGAGPRPPRRSTVAMVVADTSIPSFTELASEAPMSSSFGRNLVIGLQVAHHPAVDDVAQVTLQDPHGLL